MKQEMDLLTGKRPDRVITQLDLYYNLMTIVKGRSWQSENEWRLMWRNTDIQERVYKCPVSEDVITRIFVGLNVGEADSARLIDAARRNFPKASIFLTSKQHGKLSLQFKHV